MRDLETPQVEPDLCRQMIVFSLATALMCRTNALEFPYARCLVTRRQAWGQLGIHPLSRKRKFMQVSTGLLDRAHIISYCETTYTKYFKK